MHLPRGRNCQNQNRDLMCGRHGGVVVRRFYFQEGSLAVWAQLSYIRNLLAAGRARTVERDSTTVFSSIFVDSARLVPIMRHSFCARTG
jgi:hypothetical protein